MNPVPRFYFKEIDMKKNGFWLVCLMLLLTFYGNSQAFSGASFSSDFSANSDVVLPSVITAVPTDITTNSAQFSGNVTSDGGADVVSRGFVWSIFPLPTLDDNVLESGSGTGAFNARISGLTDGTDYYVCAFATNSAGTRYGANRSFTTLPIPEPVYKVVAQDGSGDYTTVQAAFDAVPDGNQNPYTIFVKKGTYYEKLHLTRGKTNVLLVGEHRDSTILTYDDYADIAGGTSNSFSVSIDADDFVARNITFQNTVPNDGSAPNQQAVALSVNGDRQAYYDVNILGYQDTFYARGAFGTGRIYMKNAYIEGSVDFIFGRNIVVFDSTHIHINRNNGIITAASTESGVKYGFVFRDVTVSTDDIGFDGNPITNYYLGRPWREAPRTVFINTYHPRNLHPQGWRTWNVEPADYAEFNCMGPGCADLSQRLSFSRQLTEEEASEYTLENIFSRSSYISFRDDWMPSESGPISSSILMDEVNGISLPKNYGLLQNYPNPFNPSTTIRFELAATTHVRLAVYDLTGRNIVTLVDSVRNVGMHEIGFDASRLASGLYVYRLEAGGTVLARSMSLIK